MPIRMTNYILILTNTFSLIWTNPSSFKTLTLWTPTSNVLFYVKWMPTRYIVSQPTLCISGDSFPQKITGGTSNEGLPVARILMDTGAVHASYISRRFREDMTTKHGLIVERVPVKAHVLLGDSSTRVDITEAVNLKIRFEGKRLDYESTVYLYVLESDPATPIILGLPALMSLNIFPFFMEILLDSFRAMGYNPKHCHRKIDHILSEISDISEVLTPWPSTRSILTR